MAQVGQSCFEKGALRPFHRNMLGAPCKTVWRNMNRNIKKLIVVHLSKLL